MTHYRDGETGWPRPALGDVPAHAAPILAVFSAPVAHAVSTTAVMSQIYGAGGNAGTAWRNDYVELYNKSNSPVSLAGWSLQSASATGTTWAVVALSVNMSAITGKIALVNNTTACPPAT